MSAPFSTDFSDNLKTYVTDPSKQLNLGYSVISFWYVAAFFLGLFFVAAAFIAMVFRKNYREGSDSKRPLIILIWVGFGLMVFGIWSSISSFYTIVNRINTNVRVNKECSLFMPESAQTAVDVIASSSLLNQNVADVVEKRRQALIGSRGTSDEYGAPDSRSAAVFSGVDKVRDNENALEVQKLRSLGSGLGTSGLGTSSLGSSGLGSSGFGSSSGLESLLASRVGGPRAASSGEIPKTASTLVPSELLNQQFKNITTRSQIGEILEKIVPTLREQDNPERYLKYLYVRGQELGIPSSSDELEYIKQILSSS
jgi:hypothetical protein